MLTNLELVNFCQEMLGAPYWFDAPAIKATKSAYRVNSIRYPYEYEKKDISYYEKHIEEKEVVTDSVGLIKGFMWSNGGNEILQSRGTDKTYFIKKNTNECPDKTINGMFSYAVEKGAQWGPIELLPEIPGLVITMNGRLAIYEGKGYVIEANSEKGCVRSELKNDLWKYWYELPFITYNEKIIVKPKEEKKVIELKCKGLAYSINNVLFREEPNEDSKLLDVIKKDSEVQVYNDSNDTWLHLIYDNKEGYSLTKYFIFLPDKPDVISPQWPSEIKLDISGKYAVSSNASLRDKGNLREKIYVNIPKGTEVFCTGGLSNGWYQTYIEFKNRKYVGYLNPKLLKKV